MLDNQKKVVLVILAVVVFMLWQNKNEGYSSATFRRNSLSDDYLWRTEGIQNKCSLSRHPHNYRAKPYPKRFNYYLPNFYNYGYGGY